MHPESMGALARQHQAELLRRQQFRDSAGDGSGSLADRKAMPVNPLRRALGSALVLAGTRLMAGNGTADRVIHASRESTLR